MATVHSRAKARHSRAESRGRIVEAATELVRNRSYAELSVGEIMERAGFGRTIFYRHFDDLPDLLIKAGREAIGGLYETQVTLDRRRREHDPAAVTEALAAVVDVYSRHGPLLRVISEATTADPTLTPNQEEVRRRFDELVEHALRAAYGNGANPPADFAETARALNLMNENYLLEAFGREPRISREVALRTLTEIWTAVLDR
jgi:TetR/AcrR family transcriptional regulator, ethionamide resistance regulator